MSSAAQRLNTPPSSATPEDARDAVISFLHRDLVGPAQGEQEELHEPPQKRYICGILFPQGPVDPDHTGLPSEESHPDPINFSHAFKSSSLGLTFCLSTRTKHLHLQVQGAWYKPNIFPTAVSTAENLSSTLSSPPFLCR